MTTITVDTYPEQEAYWEGLAQAMMQVETVAASEIKVGDVIVRRGREDAYVTAISANGKRLTFDLSATRDGKRYSQLSKGAASQLTRRKD